MPFSINLRPSRRLRRVAGKVAGVLLAGLLRRVGLDITPADITGNGVGEHTAPPPETTQPMQERRDTMKEKLTSRKLWLTVGAALTALCAAAGGQETWAQAVWQIVATVMAYLGVQGAVDIKTAGR